MSLLPLPALIASALLLTACSSPPPPAAPLPPESAPPPPATAKAPALPSASPIADSLPSIVPPNLPQRAVCSRGTCSLSNLVPDDVRGSVPERGPLMLWEEMIGNKARLVLPADKEVEFAGLVLEGSVGIVPREDPWSAPTKLPQWHGFHAPGGGVTLAAMGGKSARIALMIAATGADGSLAKHVESWRKDKKGFEWKQRDRKLDCIDFTALPVISWGAGAYHARIGWEAGGANGAAGASAMVLNLLRFSKDAQMPAHVHDKERECLAFLEGQGELQLTLGPADTKGNPNEKRIEVEPGTMVCIPDGMWHTWKPSGATAMLAIQVYTPPGPELEFKILAAKSP